MTSNQRQHQQVNPVVDEALADQGIAYLRYQNALMFVVPDLGVFNALMVLSMGGFISAEISTYEFTPHLWIPNVNGRPVRVKPDQAKEIQSIARDTYYAACKIYEDAEAEVQASLRKTFEAMSQEEV